ncbi:MAG: C40 family peptidase [Flavobacteriaceae bacterium]|nr:C40 family peptidase [Flavobacteriaceae bacterium]
MTKYTIAFLCFMGLVSGKSVYANENSTQLSKESAFSVESKSPVKKKKGGTIVISESKANDAAVLADLNALLEEMSMNKVEKVVADTNEVVTDQVVNAAFDYQGVRYRFGGMSKNGMDCSGLVKTAFGETEISLPRNSSEMAQMGERIGKSDAQKGDLIFFKTGRGSRISHVGIVTEVADDEIKFIHSSTSKGVIISSTKEDYYSRRFVQINRVVEEGNNTI